ncbi:hypothetical protein [Treponema pedis]|uniref:hypothetical protein n=1 Tax=Treponema pedis TaxID=409322 RepID=UPI003143A5A4
MKEIQNSEEYMMFWYLLLFVVIAVVIGVIVKEVQSKKAKKNLVEQTSTDERLKDAKIFEGGTGYFIAIAKTGYVSLKTPNMESHKIVHINDINGFELVKDGLSNSANAGSAVVGGLLFGGLGALIGGIGSSKAAISSLSFIFKLNDFDLPSIEIKFIETKTKTDSFFYKMTMEKINEIAGLLSFIEREHKKQV